MLCEREHSLFEAPPETAECTRHGAVAVDLAATSVQSLSRYTGGEPPSSAQHASQSCSRVPANVSL
jgi:hypothetical protein